MTVLIHVALSDIFYQVGRKNLKFVLRTMSWKVWSHFDEMTVKKWYLWPLIVGFCEFLRLT